MNRTDDSWLSRFLVLGTLTGLGIAQPVYDLIGRTPEFLLVHNAQPLDLLAMMAALSLGLPLVLSLMEQLIGLIGRPSRQWLHLFNVGLLSYPFFLLLAKRWLDSNTVAAVVSALLPAVLLAVAYQRQDKVGMFLRILSPVIIVFPVVFGARPGVRELLFPPTFDPVALERAEGETPVVVVVFDALPVASLLDSDGFVDAVRYPNLARLAATSTWYRKATTAADHTLKAIPAIVSGVRPRTGGLPNHTAYPVNLFTLLGPSYEMNVVERMTKLCPDKLCGSSTNPTAERLSLLASDLMVVYAHLIGTEPIRAKLPPIETNWTEFRERIEADDQEKSRQHRLQLFIDQVRSIEPKPRRLLFFLHTLLPHAPHMHLPSGRWYTRNRIEPSGEAAPWGAWVDDEWAVLHSQQRHLLQVQLADGLLGGLLNTLRRQRLFDDAIVVVTADHGASFVPGVEHRKLSDQNAADILSVPLFIKTPGQQDASIDDRPVETIDILPTVLELLHLAPPDSLDGHSLLDASWPGRATKLVSTANTTVSIDSVSLDPRQSHERLIEVFGSGTSRGNFPRVEAHPELVGQVPEGLAGEPRGYRVSLDDERRLERVQPRSPFVPAQISGHLHLPSPEQLPICLAVTVNGPIEATTCVYQKSDDPMIRRWSVLVPETTLRRGSNTVGVFVVEETEEGPSLIPTSMMPRTRE